MLFPQQIDESYLVITLKGILFGTFVCVVLLHMCTHFEV